MSEMVCAAWLSWVGSLVFLRITQYRNKGKVYIVLKIIPLYLFEFIQISGVFLVFAAHVNKY